MCAKFFFSRYNHECTGTDAKALSYSNSQSEQQVTWGYSYHPIYAKEWQHIHTCRRNQARKSTSRDFFYKSPDTVRSYRSSSPSVFSVNFNSIFPDRLNNSVRWLERVFFFIQVFMIYLFLFYIVFWYFSNFSFHIFCLHGIAPCHFSYCSCPFICVYFFVQTLSFTYPYQYEYWSNATCGYVYVYSYLFERWKSLLPFAFGLVDDVWQFIVLSVIVGIKTLSFSELIVCTPFLCRSSPFE